LRGEAAPGVRCRRCQAGRTVQQQPQALTGD
jgi:hypothetical protein